MKAEERKEIETNSLVLAVQRGKKYFTGNNLYYVIGTVALIVTAIILYRYFTSESRRARDAVLTQLANANTTEKLKQGMEDHRDSIYGSWFKMDLARHLLNNEGMPKLGTDRAAALMQAGSAVQDARTYFLELTRELKEKEQPALVQEAWYSAAQAEEALVGLPTTEGGSDSRGDVDNAVKYYESAAAIFAESASSKKYKARAEWLKANKDQFVKNQKEFYKQRDSRLPAFPGKDFPIPGLPPLPGSGKTDPFGPGLPPLPGGPSIEPPPVSDPKKSDPKPMEPAKVELPPVPKPPAVDPKKAPDPKPADPKAK